MAKFSLAGFKDPVRRPRYIIWTGVVVLMLAAVVIVALGVTSTRWFCAEACHKVQDDAIFAYENSSHANVSCMACHMPVGANPIVFVLHKAEALGELYLTVTDNFELPLNGESEVALSSVMATRQCTQCHNMDNRTITPSAGIRIDHKVHTDVNIACTVCHNRVAHNESGDFKVSLKDPKTKKDSIKHENFMEMTACFRCHGLEKDAAAPGACSACHPADFELKPASHNEGDFFPKGHADMAKASKAESEGGAEGEGEAAEGEGEKKESRGLFGPDEAVASEGGEAKAKLTRAQVGELIEEQKKIGADDHANIGEEIPEMGSVFYCATCHTEKFCSDCHGMEMPHPAAFKDPEDPKAAEGHPALSKTQAKKCVMCHGNNEKTFFCDKCHHGTKVNYEFDTKASWTSNQHPKAVAGSGVKSCTTSCHVVKFCVNCHTGRRVVPSSHRAGTWTKPKFPGAITLGTKAAEPTAQHTQQAQKSIESCEVCHGSGGIKAKFCTSCHKVELPHPDTFRTNHVSAKKNTKPCVQCHSWKQLCSNCHHVGASYKTAWTGVHGGSVNKNGAASCVEKCHKSSDCVKCHTRRNVKPASHRGAKFVRDFSSKNAQHVQLFEKDATICTYCHAGDASALPTSKFCKGCHKLDMPHAVNDSEPQKFQHKEPLKAKKMSKSQCANCHKSNFCNSCHHEGASATKPWVRYHPVIVKKSGASACLDSCHKETYCSNCHVRKAAQIMGR